MVRPVIAIVVCRSADSTDTDSKQIQILTKTDYMLIYLYVQRPLRVFTCKTFV